MDQENDSFLTRDKMRSNGYCNINSKLSEIEKDMI